MSPDKVISFLIAKGIIHRRKIYQDNQRISEGFVFDANSRIQTVEESEFRRLVDSAIQNGQAEMICEYLEERREYDDELRSFDYGFADDFAKITNETIRVKVLLIIEGAEPSLTIKAITS